MKRSVPVLKLMPLYAMVLIGCISAAVLGSRAVTTMVESAPIEGRTCLIIDAGHGGIDGGATSCTGIPESQLNLEIALRLNDLLHFLGYDTKMIRTTDTSVYTEGNTIAAQKVSDLKQRVKIVNETPNAFLISIHQNTYPEGKYSGAQVFYANNAHSKEMAVQLQTALRQTLNPASKRQCKSSDGIYLMQHIERPGVLIECGFLTNPREEALLRSKDYQKKLACVISSSVSQFLSM